MLRHFFKNWWNWLKYEPADPRFQAGGHIINICVIGGGTGLSVMLRGLKKYSNSITAIVSTSDDGDSSGFIKKEFDILPPGDIRKCISALAYDEELIANLMEYRFSKDRRRFGGHTLGNIWITALTKYFGSFESAIEATTEIFKLAGKVIPVTLARTELCARYKNGQVIIGESRIPKAGQKIQEVYFNKKNIHANKKAILALEQADLIVIGPGSLYTSLVPNLLVKRIVSSITNNKKAVKVFVCNCSTERGETEQYGVEDHIKELYRYGSNKLFDFCLVNDKIIKIAKDASKLGTINNITTTRTNVLGAKIFLADLVNNRNPLYHDSDKLAKALIELYNKTKGN